VARAEAKGELHLAKVEGALIAGKPAALIRRTTKSKWTRLKKMSR
jgi:hypothetical protein